MVDELIDPNVLNKLIDENLIQKNEDGNWILSPKLVEVINQKTAITETMDSATSQLESANNMFSDVKSDLQKLPSLSDKYRPPAKTRGSDDFLDTLNFDLKESNVQARIRSELQSEAALPQEQTTEASSPDEIDDLFDDALGESMEDFLSDFDDVIVVEKVGGKPVLSGPIIDILTEQGYIKGDLSTEEELGQVPEYEVLRTIIKEHPIPLTALEEKTSVDSLSLVLSNLQADNLIIYTNDYQWTISEKVKENLIEFMSQKQDPDEVDKLRNKILRETTYERQFIHAMFKLKIISSYDMGMIEMAQIPEFSLLKAVKDHEPANLETIQKSLDRSLDLPPVQLARILSQLENEGYISSTTNDTWVLSEKLIRILVE